MCELFEAIGKAELMVCSQSLNKAYNLLQGITVSGAQTEQHAEIKQIVRGVNNAIFELNRKSAELEAKFKKEKELEDKLESCGKQCSSPAEGGAAN